MFVFAQIAVDQGEAQSCLYLPSLAVFIRLCEEHGGETAALTPYKEFPDQQMRDLDYCDYS